MFTVSETRKAYRQLIKFVLSHKRSISLDKAEIEDLYIHLECAYLYNYKWPTSFKSFVQDIPERCSFIAAKEGVLSVVKELVQVQEDYFVGPDYSRMKGYGQVLFEKSMINAAIHGAIIGHQKEVLDFLIGLPPRRCITKVRDLEISVDTIKKSYMRGYDMIDYVLQLDHPIGDLLFDAIEKLQHSV
jgi:hypothetical protein